MGDQTRYADLKQLYNARDGKSVAEKEQIGQLMHNIQRQDNPQLNRMRSDLVGAMRAGDGRSSRKISEQIKHFTHQEGLENRG